LATLNLLSEKEDAVLLMHHFVEEEAENCSLSNLMIPDPTKDQKLG